MSDIHHPILKTPWKYRVIEVIFRCGCTQIDAELDLTFCKNDEVITLRFAGVSELEIEPGFPWQGSGIQILDVSSRGMEQARIRVNSFEQDPAIRFWAKEVSIASPQPG